MARVTLERFQRIPLTTRLTDEQVLALLPRVEEISLSKGEVLFEQGDPAVYVYYVEQGKVAEVERVPVLPIPPVSQGTTGGQLGAQKESPPTQPSPGDTTGAPPTTREVVHRYAGQGEYLGRYALVTGQPFRISAVAEEDSVLLAIPLRYMQPFLFAHEDWRTWFFRSDIATRLRAVPLFMDLDDWDIYRLADATLVTEHAAHEIIFEPGHEADCLYIVDRGQVIEPRPPTGTVRGEWPRYFGPGNFFGHRSLQRGQARQTTTVAWMPTRLFCISGQMIRQLLADRTDEILQEQARVDLPGRLQEIPQFRKLTREYLHMLSGYVCLEYHRPGDIVARQGEPATSLMILVKGEAVVRLQFGKGQPRTVTHFKAHRRGGRPGTSEENYFGAHALFEEELRGATVEVTRPSVWLSLHRDDFQRFMQETGLSVADLKRGAAPDLPLPFKVHQHWIVPVSRILPLALLMYLILELMASDLLSEGLLATGVVVLIGLAVAMLYFLVNWLDNTLEVTTWSVIHTKRNLRFELEWVEIPLQQIESINTSANGVERWFRAGDLVIQTAHAEVKGDKEVDKSKIDFKMAPSPNLVKDLIWEAVSEEVWATEFLLPLPAKIRRHWLVAASQIVPLILLLYLVLELVRSGVLGGFAVIGLMFLAGIAAAIPYLFVNWLDDALEVTAQSVIRTRRKMNASLERFETPLHQVQGVSISTQRRFLGAGTLTIDLPSHMQQIGVAMIPSPPAARDLILTAAASEQAQIGAPAPSPEGEVSLPYKVRRHWVIPFSHLLPLGAIIFSTVLVMGTGILGAMTLPLGVFLLVVFGFWALYRFVDWLNDTYEVTARAVIHTERKLFFSAERYEIPLQQIQNVTVSVSVIGRYLGFGNVDIDTAAARGRIAFTTIPHPAHVQQLIQKASAQARSGLTVQRRESIRQQIEDQLYPERLKPSIPGSAQIPPEEPPKDGRLRRFTRFRDLRGWFPRFEIRENGQVIWRKHWINLLQRTGPQFLLFLLSIYLVLSFALASLTASLGMAAIMLPPVVWIGFQGWLFLIILFLSALAALWFLYQYVDWRNDIYIVTDDEVIDVERQLAIFPFFFFYTESRKQASLTKVQYVDLKIPNPLAMILNYGNVIVQTAGAEGTLDFLWVSNPRNVHAEILRRLTAFEEREREREFQERWADMPRWFETYRDVIDQTSPPHK